MKGKHKPGFLILGVARSGTTMLQKLLDGHSEMAVCPESDIFTSLYRTTWRGQFSSAWHYRQFMNYLSAWLVNFNDPAVAVVNQFLSENDAYQGSVRNLLKILTSNYLQSRSKSIFGEKTPQNIYHLSLVRRICPDAKLIILFRHPYDIICSIAKLLAENTGDKSGKLTDDHLLQAAVFVKWGIQSLTASQLDDSTSISVRYEDLLDNTSNEISRICHFLDLEFEPEMLHFQTDTLLLDQQRMAYLHPKLAQQIDAKNKGKYKQILSSSQEQLVYQFLGTALKNMPYTITDNQSDLGFRKQYALLKYNIRFGVKHHLWKDEIIRIKLLVKYMVYRLKRAYK